MLDAGTCADHLNIAGSDASLIPLAVAMTHRTVADISDDFHVGMGVRWETAVWCDLVVVPHAQRTPPGPVKRGGEMMLGFEPRAAMTG
jgi:hypothetical protein